MQFSAAVNHFLIYLIAETTKRREVRVKNKLFSRRIKIAHCRLSQGRPVVPLEIINDYHTFDFNMGD